MIWLLFILMWTETLSFTSTEVMRVEKMQKCNYGHMATYQIVKASLVGFWSRQAHTAIKMSIKNTHGNLSLQMFFGKKTTTKKTYIAML